MSHRSNPLIQTLRDANSRVQRNIDATRESRHRKNHAKKRARHLGLTIDIKKAVNCCQRQVSVIPLPVIDIASPITLTPVHLSQNNSDDWREHRRSPLHRRPALRRTSPTLISNYVTPTYVDDPCSTSELSPLSSSVVPAVREALVFHCQNVPWRGPTSRFTMSPPDAAPKICIFSPSKRVMVVDNNRNDPDMNINMPATPVLCYRDLPDVPLNEDWDMNISLQPLHSNPSSFNSDFYNPALISNGSFSGPMPLGDISSLPVRVKRKFGGFEKRPKFGRKRWLMSLQRKANRPTSRK